MTIDHTWNLQRTICILTFHHDWTWVEYEQSYVQLKQNILSHSHNIYTIWDLTHNPNVPIGALSKFRSYDTRIGMPTNFKGAVIVTESVFLRSLLDVFRRSIGNHTPQPVWSAKTVAEAEAMLQKEIEKETMTS